MQDSAVKSLDRASSLLLLLRPVQSHTEWSLVQLQEASGLPVSTLHRFLSQWAKVGFVEHNPDTHRYKLGSALTALGIKMWRDLAIRQAARPVMRGLAHNVRLSVYLTIRDGSDGVYVERAKPPMMLRTSSPIGQRTPLYLGASRKILLAYMELAEAEALVQSFTYEAIGPNSPTSAEQLRSQLREIREQGYALTFGETVDTTAGLAVPIRDEAGQVVAALMVSGQYSVFLREDCAALLEALRPAAAAVAERLKDTIHRAGGGG